MPSPTSSSVWVTTRVLGLSLLLLLVLGVTGVTSQGDLVGTDERVGTFTFKQLYCPNHGIYMWFYTLTPGPVFEMMGGVAFEFQENASAIGGWKIMAGFKGNDGINYTREEGWDPCAYTNCIGVVCRNRTAFLAQGYKDYSLYAFGKTDQLFEYHDYGEAFAPSTPRCGCWDPNLSVLYPNESYDAYIVDPAGPSSEQDDPNCPGLTCNNTLYYLNSTDRTVATCRCCRKERNLMFIEDQFERTCGEITPITSTGSSSSGGGSSGGGGPDPIAPPTSLYEFVTAACPAGTLTNIPQEVIDNNSTAFCCYLTSSYNENDISYHCGTDLLSLGAAGILNCVSSIPANEFTCCADITFGGSVSTTGRVCKGAISSGNGDAAGAVASPLLATLVALVFGLVAITM